MEQFQDFLRSDIGIFITFLVAGISFIGLSGIFFKRAKISMKTLTYTGLAMSIAFMLSFITIYTMPQGGSLTLMSMFFVSIIGFWFGPAIGLVAGLSYGLLQIVQGAWVIHPIQLLLDYPLAFGMLGLSGFFYKMKGGLYIGFIVGCLGRFVMSTLAGWFYWIGIDSPGSLWASMLYNGSYVFPEMALTLVVISIPAVRHGLAHIKATVTGEAVVS